MAQFARPDLDTYNLDLYTDQGGGPVLLFQAIDEASPNDAGTAAGNDGGLGIADGTLAVAGAYMPFTATLATSSEKGFMTIALVEADRRGINYWAEFETPTPPRSGRAYWVELEVPPEARRGLVYFVEVEVPPGPRRGRTYWAVLQVPPGSSLNEKDLQDFLLLLDRHDGGRRRIER